MNTLHKMISRIQRPVKLGVQELYGKLGLSHTYYTQARGARIIAYHGVCEKDPLRFNTLFISRENFEQQLRFYREYFHVISLDDFYEGNFHPDRFNICLSFDDGFANNHHWVLPLLERYRMPASFFITGIRKEGGDILWNDFLTLVTAHGPLRIRVGERDYYKKANKYVSENGQTLASVLRGSSFVVKKAFMQSMEPYAHFRKDVSLNDYWLQLTADQIRALAASPLVTIGSHGYYHNDLANDTHDVLVDELQRSKQFLEETIQQPVVSLAFPYGSYSDMVLDEAWKAGYRQLLGTELLKEEDHAKNYLKERTGINPFIRLHSQMQAIIKGHYD